MDVLYLLIPLSVLAILAVLGVFAWAVQSGQFDELEAEGARILEPGALPLDTHQGRLASATEESRPFDLNAKQQESP